MPKLFTSSASASDIPSSANFDAEYAPTPSKDIFPPIDEIFIAGLLHRADHTVARVVEQIVDAAEPLDRRVDGRLQV